MVWYGMVRCFDTQRIPLDCFMCWFNTQFQAGVTNKRLEASTLGFLLGKNIRARIFFSFPQSCRMTASQILDSKTDGRRFMKMWFQTIDFFLNGLTLPNSSSHYSPRFSSPPTFRAVWWGIGWYLTDMSRHASTLRFSNASREVWMSIRPLTNSTCSPPQTKWSFRLDTDCQALLLWDGGSYLSKENVTNDTSGNALNSMEPYLAVGEGNHILYTELGPCSATRRISRGLHKVPELSRCCLPRRMKPSTPPWRWMRWSRWSPRRPAWSREVGFHRWPCFKSRAKILQEENLIKSK